MRNLIVWLHRWVALILGAFIILISITGSLIIIEGPVDRALNADLLRAAIPSSGPVRLPLDSLLVLARARGEVGSLTLPQAEGRALVASMRRAGELFLNPYTGQVIGSRPAQQPSKVFFRVSHLIHVELFGKGIGNQVVLWSTIASVFLILGGIYLWWKDKVWRLHLAASGKRINFDLHHLLGITTFVVLFLITATGVIMHYPIIARAIGKLDRGSAPAAAPQSQPAPGAPTVSLDAAARAGLAALPGSELRTISIPADAKRAIALGLRFPEDRTADGRSRIYVDRWTGAILYVGSSRTEGLGTRINKLQRPLHTGDVFGAPTQVIWFLGCWVIVAQAVTGLLMWWHARPARKADVARKLKTAAG